MLGLEVERFIREAWLKLRGKILSDRYELQKRLARRRLKTFNQPPRAWCIAIRASDRRITPAHWVISPEHAMDLNHPAHPYEPIEHEVTIQAHAIRRYCHPVSFSIERAVEVAGMLGVSSGTLMHARRRGRFFEDYKRGPRGRRIPFLSPNRQLFDPCHRDYRPPHPIWGGKWEWLAREMPRDFEQTVVRRPVFRRFGRKRFGAQSVDLAALTPARSRGEREEYAYKDEMKLGGWRWVCPRCKKEVRTIYYPVPVRTLFDCWFIDPVIQLKLSDADLPERPPAVFACMKCHGVWNFSSIVPDSWNRVIAYLTAGMLYGSEVEKPASFVPERKKTRARQLNREAPVKRKVFARLKLGWSDFQIARDLGMTLANVGSHVGRMCREEGVANRYALAKKLNFAPQRLNYWEAARVRRLEVAELMLRECSRKEMMEKLGVDWWVLGKDIKAVYKAHGIKAKAHGSKRELAEKMGRTFVSRFEMILGRVKELRESGLKWREVAGEMGVSRARMDSYRQALARREKVEQMAGKSIDSQNHPIANC